MNQTTIIATNGIPVSRRTTIIGARGPQGIPGPEGPQGVAGPPGPAGTSFNHIQASASTEWVVNHNLGVSPLVTALTPGGAEMICEVLHTSLNQARLYFVTPQTGTARCV